LVFELADRSRRTALTWEIAPAWVRRTVPACPRHGLDTAGITGLA
jgi:hypothetical protein